jgi:hypothetical protein
MLEVLWFLFVPSLRAYSSRYLGSFWLFPSSLRLEVLRVILAFPFEFMARGIGLFWRHTLGEISLQDLSHRVIAISQILTGYFWDFLSWFTTLTLFTLLKTICCQVKFFHSCILKTNLQLVSTDSTSSSGWHSMVEALRIHPHF